MDIPKVIYGADVGIRLDTLDEARRTQLEWLLTATSRAWKNNPSITVEGYHADDTYLWVPRQFAIQHGFKPDLDNRTLGVPQNLEFKAKLDPKRGQVAAVPAMVQYLRENTSGLLVAPTGCGKTLLSYCIGSHFQTSLGVFIYAGHMVDNWIEQANLAFGLSPEDVGLVQQNRCDLGKPVTLLSIQSLLSREYPPELYQQFGFLIADEVNRYGAAEWNRVIRMFPGIYRLGVSADPGRPDGLERVIEWNLGKIGYTIKKRTVKLTVVRVHVNATYPPNSYKDWGQSTEDEFVADALRYNKKISTDPKRNAIIISELLNARKTGRRIIVFSQLRDHLDTLKLLFDEALVKAKAEDAGFPDTTTDYLVGGMKKKAREAAMAADIKFATYGYCRDAMNDPTNDTLFFATPPGNPLQPAGRLRDKGPDDRKPLMIVDFTEDTPYSDERWSKRERTYSRLDFILRAVSRKID